MTRRKRWEAEWRTQVGTFRVYEPTAREVAEIASRLAAYYTEPHNRAMMAHEADLTPEDVVEHFQRVNTDGRGLLLELDGRLMGDADLRHVAGTEGETAIMIGDRSTQGKGLGTRFGLMIHAIAFQAVGLERVYVSIIPANRASQRLFEKLGYVRDNGPKARGYADEDDDVTMSVTRAMVVQKHGEALSEIEVRERPAPN